MTRKDYVAIAHAIKVSHNVNVGSQPQWIVDAVLAEVADNIATVMRQDNPRFNRETFYAACEIEVSDMWNHPEHP